MCVKISIICNSAIIRVCCALCCTVCSCVLGKPFKSAAVSVTVHILVHVRRQPMLTSMCYVVYIAMNLCTVCIHA